MMNRIYTMSFIILTFLTVPALFADEVKTVQSEGIGAIKNENIPAARDEALDDALRRAVEQTVGTLVESETLVENYDLLSDRIYTQSKGYIQGYDLLSEGAEENIYRVSIKARVSMNSLEKDLDAIGVLMERMEKPRVMVMITEGNIQNINFWDHFVANISEAETEVIAELRAKGFYVVDAMMVKQNLQKAEALAALSGDAGSAALIGQKQGADVVIIGDALATTGGRVAGSDLVSCQASLNLRALNSGTGEVIATATADASAVHINPTTGSQRAIRDSSKKAAAVLIRQILEKWSQEAGGLRNVGVYMTGISHEQLDQLRQAMLDNIRGLKEVRIRDYSEGNAYVEVGYRGSGMNLAKEMESLAWGAKIRLIGVTQNRIEAKIEK